MPSREGGNHPISLINRLAGIDAGKELNINSGGDVTLRGVESTSGEDTNITATGDVNIVAVQDQQSKDLKLDIKTSGLLGTETNIRRQSASTETKGSNIETEGTLTITSKKEDVTVKASRLASEDETTLSAEEGKVALLTNTDSEFKRDEQRQEDIFWWSESDEGHVKETIKHVEIEAGGGLKINAGEGVVVEYQKTGDLTASIDQLARSPGLEWIGQLKDDPRVDWVEVQARFDEWDYENQGLTEAGAAFVSLVVAAVSSGTLSGLSATLAHGMGFAADGVVQAALQAGLNSLAKQTTIALINNQGDLGATLETLGSSASLRSLATAMVAAGLTAHISNIAGVGAGTDLPKTAPLADRVALDIRRSLIRASVNTGISTAIQGGKLDENLVSALKMEAAYVIGKNLAQEIGEAFHSGEINKFTQLIAHAAVGCASGALASGDCGSGALGAVVGEVTAEVLEQRIQDRLLSELSDGSITKEEALIMASEMRAQGVDIARLASGLGAALAGVDVNTAAETGGTAAENNAYWLPVIIVIKAILETADRVLIAKDAVDIAMATKACNQGSQAACNEAKDLAEQAAIDVSIEFSVGALVPGSKTAADLLRWVRKNSDADTRRAVDRATNKGLTGSKGNWSLSGQGSGQFIEVQTASAGKVTYTVQNKVDGYVITKGPDGKPVVFGSDPLAGTKTGTLDTKWSDQQFYNQLKRAKEFRDNAKDPVLKTRWQKIVGSFGNIAKFLDKID